MNNKLACNLKYLSRQRNDGLGIYGISYHASVETIFLNKHNAGFYHYLLIIFVEVPLLTCLKYPIFQESSKSEVLMDYLEHWSIFYGG